MITPTSWHEWTRQLKRKCAAVAAIVCAQMLGPPIAAQADPASESISCSGQYAVNKTLPNGATWVMCWEISNRRGLQLTNILFKPAGATKSFPVLASATLAELFVPYDSGLPRYYDIGGFGYGYNTLPLAKADCPAGELREQRGVKLLCVSTERRGYAYKNGSKVVQGNDLVVFDVSSVSYYNTITEWRFADDGTIRARVGFTGTLSPDDFTDSGTGWPIGSGSAAYAENHTHVVAWRLDFDVMGTADDTVEQFDYAGSGTASRKQSVARIPREASRLIAPMRFWRVVDGRALNADKHKISWEIDVNGNDEYRGPVDEAFTNADVWMTNYKICEDLVSLNADGPCEDSLDKFVNNEPLSDPVVWVQQSFHHVPRDEDGDPRGEEPEPFGTHWQEIQIRPRDVVAGPPIK